MSKINLRKKDVKPEIFISCAFLLIFILCNIISNENLIDEYTLTFVAIHELSHVMTKSIGHKQEFWDNFKFLLENAKEAKIHHPPHHLSTIISSRQYPSYSIHPTH